MYIGISGYNHESSAALINNEGQLVNYYREESLSRIKGDKSFPKRAISLILKTNGIEINDVISIAFYERPLSSFLYPLKVAAYNMPRSIPFLSHQFRNFKKSSIACYLDLAMLFPGLESKLIYADHHLSHTLSALAYSKKQNDICSIVVDGFGDRSTTSISEINNIFNIKEIWSSSYPHSLGLFYSAITDFLGFQINEGEYKVMGLSAYGNSESLEAKLVSNLVNWDSLNKKIIVDMSYFDYHISIQDSFSENLIDLLGEPRNPFLQLYPDDPEFQRWANIARGAQDTIELALCKLFQHAYELTASRQFLFSGGVALNSASLESISNLPFVDEVIVPPSPGDAGAAIGAGYYAYLKKNVSSKQIQKPSLFPANYNFLKQKDLAANILAKDFLNIESDKDRSLKIVANLIQKGEVIGILLQNGETGPRALGNRSLICNGKDSKAVYRLNRLIKDRSPFRPTAPCMGYKAAQKYYDLKPELLECYKSMSATCKCLKENESLGFPTTHIDGTARIQIISETDFLYEIYKETVLLGVDVLANSSLNMSGDPTCFDLIDGLMVCARTPLKYLLTDFGLLEKKEK